MSELGPDQAAASGVVAAMQGLITGTSGGFLTSVGSELSKLQSKKVIPEYAIANLLKVGGIKIFCIGLISFGFCQSTRLWLPLILKNQNTAKQAADYMTGYSGAPLSEYFIITASQVVFKIEKNSWFTLVTSITYRSLSVAIALALEKYADTGMKEIGLGCTLAATATSALVLLWLICRKSYREIEGLLTLKTNNIISNLKLLIKSGFRFSLQRFTEWGNLFIIAQIIGAWSNDNLLAFQPSMIVLLLTGQLVQGFSLGGMLMANTNNKALIEKLQEIKNAQFLDEESPINGSNLEKLSPLIIEASGLLKKSKKYLLVTNASGLVLNTVIAGTCFLMRDLIIDWIMPTGVSPIIKDTAKTYLSINLLSTFPDSIRVISASSLESWDNLGVSILNSLTNMTIIGIPLAAAISVIFENKDITPFFYVRVAAISVSALINAYVGIKHIMKCSDELSQVEKKINNNFSYANNQQTIFSKPNYDSFKDIQDVQDEKKFSSKENKSFCNIF